MSYPRLLMLGTFLTTMCLSKPARQSFQNPDVGQSPRSYDCPQLLTNHLSSNLPRKRQASSVKRQASSVKRWHDTIDPISFRRDNRRGLHCRDHFQKTVGIKSLICRHRAHVLHPFDKIHCFGDVVLLPAGQTKSDQIAQPIDDCMNLGAQAPTRTAKTLLPVFLAHRQRVGGHGQSCYREKPPQSLHLHRAWRKWFARPLCPPNAKNA